MTTHSSPRIPLPKSWTTHVRDAVLHIISLAQFATAYTRGWAANSINPRLRRRAEVDRLTEEVAVLKEELRIKDARMTAVPARRRPHYAATDRMAILELKAARGWSARQTADRFLVTDATIASWVKRVDDDTLVQIAHPVI